MEPQAVRIRHANGVLRMNANEQKTVRINGGNVPLYQHTFNYTLTVKATNRMNDAEFSEYLNKLLLSVQNHMIDELGINARISNLSYEAKA